MLKKLFETIKYFFIRNSQVEPEQDPYHFQWLEIGDENNPFNKKVLDIRGFTHTIISVSKGGDQFDFFRKSDGFYLKESDTDQFKTVDCHFF